MSAKKSLLNNTVDNEFNNNTISIWKKCINVYIYNLSIIKS